MGIGFNRILRESLRNYGIVLLKSDSIRIGEAMPLPGGMVGIVAGDGRKEGRTDAEGRH